MSGAFSSFAAFLHMGGYAYYVWPAYVLVLIVLLANGIIAWRQFRSTRQKLRLKHDSLS